MPSRTLRESYTYSDKVAQMAPAPQDRFPRYFLAADDFGCILIQPEMIKGRIYARRPDITPEIVAADLKEFERVGCLLTWTVADKTFGWFTGWWEHNRQPRPKTVRKTPTPPVSSALSEQEQGGNSEPNLFDRKYTAAHAQEPAAQKRPQFAVRSSQFAHVQDPPVSPPKEPGGQEPKVVSIRVGPERVKLQKRLRRTLSLAEKAEFDRQEKRDQRSKLLHAWVKKALEPMWDEAAGAEVAGRVPPTDQQLAWVQEYCRCSPTEAADAVALVAEALAVETRSHGAV